MVLNYKQIVWVLGVAIRDLKRISLAGFTKQTLLIVDSIIAKAICTAMGCFKSSEGRFFSYSC